MYRDYDTTVSESAAKALANFTFDGQIEIFFKLLEHGDHHMPGIAMENLIKIGQPAVLKLKSLYQRVETEETDKDKKDDMKKDILEILNKIDPDLDPVLREEKRRLDKLFREHLEKLSRQTSH